MKKEYDEQQLIKRLESGDEEARYELYCCYLYGDNKQTDKAIALFKPVAEAGNARAECTLGGIFNNYLNDRETARTWYERAAEHGYSRAREILDEWEREANKRVKTGIFWVVPDGEGGQTVLHMSKTCALNDADSLGFINYRYSHFEMWDYVRDKRTSDCYRYPRGRVLFDVEADRHIIYADKCIGFETIEEVLDIFEIDEYELRGDEHYVCGRCGDKND